VLGVSRVRPGSVGGVNAQPAVAAKTERLLNLVIALLSTRRPLTKALAARSWTQASLAAPAAAAMAKLASAGVELDDTSLVRIEPRVRTSEPAFEPMRRSVQDRQEVRFDYVRADGERGTRTVRPWGMAMWRGRWYVTGWDVDRGAERVFRLSRVAGPVALRGGPAAYEIPADHVPRVLVGASEPGFVDQPPAILRIRAGAGNTLRRRARTVGEIDEEWSLVDVDYRDVESLSQEVAGFGPDVLVEAPERVRDAVVARLSAAGDRHRPGMPQAEPGMPQSTGNGAAQPGGTAPAGQTLPAARSAARPSRPHPESASARLSRLLALVPWLLGHQGVALDVAAHQFGITPAQLESDLLLLFVCGTPGHLPDDLIEADWEDGRVYVGNADAIARPLRLTIDEAVTLMVGLRALAATPGIAERDAVVGALAKLEAATGEAAGVAARVHVTLDDGAQEALVARLRGALEDTRRLRLRYQSAGRDEVTEREVDPMRLVNLEAHWYLEGWCHRAEDVRLFRLDRIVGLEVLDVPGVPPEQARGRDLAGAAYLPGAGDALVELVTEREAAWVADYYPVESVDELGEGRRLVRLRAADTGWVVRLAWRLGGLVTVREPVALATAVREGAAAAVAAYGLTDDDRRMPRGGA
jgi:predicted DNA-binding transcriptional regulator YafY